MLETFGGALLGAAFLYAFFKAVQLNWPESYFGVGEMAAYAISASPWKYVLFRFGPVLVTSLFVGVSVERAGGDGQIGALATATLHAALTSGWGLAQAARWPADIRRRRRPILIVRMVVLVGVLGIGVLAAAIRGLLAPVVPPLSDLSATLWTGLIAGVLGAFIVRVSRGHPVHEHEMIDRSKNEIPKELWNLAARVALENEADVDLARAIMVVENLQRPSWFRRIERLKGRISPAGTYGVMQVTSLRPLSDAESIEKVVRDRLRGVNVRAQGGWPDSDLLAAFARSYNGSRDFLALLEVAYGAVRPDQRPVTTSLTANDRRPVIEVEVVEKLDGDVRLEGTALLPSRKVIISEVGRPDGQKQVANVMAVSGERGSWQTLLSTKVGVSTIIVGGYWPERLPTEVLTDSAITIDLTN